MALTSGFKSLLGFSFQPLTPDYYTQRNTAAPVVHPRAPVRFLRCPVQSWRCCAQLRHLLSRKFTSYCTEMMRASVTSTEFLGIFSEWETHAEKKFLARLWCQYSFHWRMEGDDSLKPRKDSRNLFSSMAKYSRTLAAGRRNHIVLQDLAFL